jgi:hypothetical protein
MSEDRRTAEFPLECCESLFTVLVPYVGRVLLSQLVERLSNVGEILDETSIIDA